jgi:hypothetical protein
MTLPFSTNYILAEKAFNLNLAFLAISNLIQSFQINYQNK